MQPSLWISLALIAACAQARERVLTTAPHGHLIHNRQVFSPDGRFIYYDSRNDETQLAAAAFIGRIEVATGREEVLYRLPAALPHGPGVGAVTCNPVTGQLAFIRGLTNASAEQPYAPHRRCGVSLDATGKLTHLDARDVTPPFTPGALSGGTHAHHWSPDGLRLSFTYNDALIPIRPAPADLRSVGVMTLGQSVTVADPVAHTEFSGSAFATLIVPVTAHPTPGSDEISRAFDEAWLDPNQLAFQGLVRTADGSDITELFLATLPAKLGPATPQTDAPPAPPPGISIRRLTHTAGRKFPGIQGARHWVRPAPDRSLIAFLAKDDQGIVQLFGVAPAGGPLQQLSRLTESVATPFDWAPDSRHLACAAGGRLQLIDVATGAAEPLTAASPAGQEPRYSVCFSPDGKHLATNRLLPHPDSGNFIQITVVELP